MRHAFTLVEILIVVAVFVILLVLVLGVARHVMQDTDVQQTKLMMKVLHDRMLVYLDIHKAWPSDLAPQRFDGLGKPNPSEVLDPKFYPNNPGDPNYHKFVDAWHNPILLVTSGDRFLANGQCPLLQSYGPDGVQSSDDLFIP